MKTPDGGFETTAVSRNTAVVLHRPRYPGNIGSAARAMRNTGFSRLHVVAPRDFDETKIRTMATRAVADVIDGIEIHDNLDDCLAPFQYVVGTTARLGGERHHVKSPDTVAQTLLSIAAENRVALLFGPEDRGLTNQDLRLCHAIVNIPTAEFSSLNLSQAVLILCYEIFKTAQNRDRKTAPPVPRLASRHELDGLYAELKDILVRISFINPENPDYWLNRIRFFFNRIGLRSGEVRILRGICRQIDWYAQHRYREGLAEEAKSPPASPGKEPTSCDSFDSEIPEQKPRDSW